MDGFDGDARDEASKCQDVTKAQVKAREGEILLKWSKPQPLKKTPHEQPRVNIDVNCPAVFNIRAFDVATDAPPMVFKWSIDRGGVVMTGLPKLDPIETESGRLP